MRISLQGLGAPPAVDGRDLSPLLNEKMAAVATVVATPAKAVARLATGRDGSRRDGSSRRYRDVARLLFPGRDGVARLRREAVARGVSRAHRATASRRPRDGTATRSPEARIARGSPGPPQRRCGRPWLPRARLWSGPRRPPAAPELHTPVTRFSQPRRTLGVRLRDLLQAGPQQHSSVLAAHSERRGPAGACASPDHCRMASRRQIVVRRSAGRISLAWGAPSPQGTCGARWLWRRRCMCWEMSLAPSRASCREGCREAREALARPIARSREASRRDPVARGRRARRRDGVATGVARRREAAWPRR